MHTQNSSQPRLQNDTLGNEALQQLYKAYENMNFEDFRVFAEGVVMAGGGKQPKKIQIIEEMYKNTSTKPIILKKAQDFILAGMGLGV